MENTEEKDKFMFELTVFFYQLETMLKSQNAMLTDKISEGDLVSSSLAFNNSLILSSLKKIMTESEEVAKYANSEEFKERLKNMLGKFAGSDKNDLSQLN